MKSEFKISQPVDGRVTITMIACSLLALIIFGFRYKTTDPSFPVNIVIGDSVLYTQQLIMFSAEGNEIGTKNLSWDFGDNQHSKGTKVYHQYELPGVHEVTLTVNGKHPQHKMVYVKKAPSVKPPRLLIMGPETAVTGQTVTFKDTTVNASKWNWYFEETSTVNATTQTATYKFKTEGLFKVILIVNDSIRGEHFINIVPKTPKPKPPLQRLPDITREPVNPPIKPDSNNEGIAIPINPPVKVDSSGADNEKKVIRVVKAPSITNEKLTSMLFELIQGKRVASDFSKYMRNLNIKVTSNGQDATFNSFCDQLRRIGKSKKVSLNIINVFRDPGTNYIESMSIAIVTKKGK